MKTFSEFKRRLTVGTILQSENHKRPESSGPREIVKVQTNGVWYLFGPDKKKGFTDFGKASDARVSDRSVTFLDPITREPIFTYHLPEAR